LLRLLTRTATNTYFPQVATVISLPSADDALSGLGTPIRFSSRSKSGNCSAMQCGM